MDPNIQGTFQICISVPLNNIFFFEKKYSYFFLYKFSNKLINVNSELNKKNLRTQNGLLECFHFIKHYGIKFLCWLITYRALLQQIKYSSWWKKINEERKIFDSVF